MREGEVGSEGWRGGNEVGSDGGRGRGTRRTSVSSRVLDLLSTMSITALSTSVRVLSISQFSSVNKSVS